ncbi:Hsp20/alpha crystallin family protein [Cribrihabitans neustonicus]|uniref:Hsp20/alpha crystallin family protein n=1 Tax=Cribrihabitans neustonicus TaxID=1429085 RepID=UPI003B5B0A4A
MHISDLIPWGRGKDKTPDSSGGRTTNPLATLQRDINNVFEDFWRKVENGWNGRSAPIGMFGPSTDVSEADDTIEVTVELPGMTEKDIDISMSGDALTIRGEKKVEHEEKRRGIYMSERSYGAFYRTIPLPPGVDTEKAEATFKNGVLTIALPKTAASEARVKRIPVKAS